MRLIIASVLFLFIGQYSIAQTVMGTDPKNTVFIDALRNPLITIMSRHDIDAINSSRKATFETLGGKERFFSADWLSGSVMTVQNNIVNSDKYKYNYDFITHQLLARKGDTIIAVNLEKVNTFTLKDNAGNHLFYKFPGIDSKDFEELLSNDPAAGKLKLIKKHGVTIIKYQSNAGTALSGDRSDTYQNDNSYYMMYPDGSTQKIRLNTNWLVENMKPDYRAKTKDLMGANKKPDEDSLTMLVNGLNSK